MALLFSLMDCPAPRLIPLLGDYSLSLQVSDRGISLIIKQLNDATLSRSAWLIFFTASTKEKKGLKTALSFEWIERHYNSIKSSAILMIILSIPAVYGLVYLTGGANAYSHSMYALILFAGFVFGIKGGVIVGVIAGVTLGPFMPIDTVTMEPQQAVNWIYRSGFFVIIGFLSGAASDSTRRYMKHVKWLTQHDAVSGLSNRSALIDSLKTLKHGRHTKGAGTLAVISIENVLELETAFGPDVTGEAVMQLATGIGGLLGDKAEVYRISTYHIAVLFFC